MAGQKRRLTIVLSFAAVGIAFFILNLLTPLYADDYSYCFTFTVGEKLRVTNLQLLIRSQVGHYRAMNGRTVAHTLAQLFLMWGKPVFNVVNTAVFLLLAWAMQGLMTGEQKVSLPLFLFSAAGLWFVTPAFGQDYLWLTASCTYSACILLILLYLLPFRRAWAGETPGGWVRAVFFFFFGVLAGWSQENAAAAMLVMVVCWLAALGVRGRPVRAWMFTGLAGNLTGVALLLLAPGQSARLSNSGGMGGLGTWLRRALSITELVWRYLWLPALLLVVLFVWRLNKDGWAAARAGWQQWLPVPVFLAGSLASAYAMILAPQFPSRAWGPVVVFVLIAVGSGLACCPGLRLPRPAVLAVCGVTLAAVLLTYGQALVSLSRTGTRMEQRTQQVQAALDRGEREVTLAPIRGDSRYNCFDSAGDLGPDSTQWPNTAIAMYYGLDAVHRGEDQE